MAKRKAKKKQAAKKKDNILYMGLDLGTSRSAVCASNGRRKWVESYVGWPRDFVAKKTLGDRPVFGADALYNRLSLEVCRPLEHGVIREGTARDEESVAALIEHLVELGGPKAGETIYAAAGVPAEALKVNKLALREAVAEYAETLAIVSEPFAVAYGQGLLNDALIIDIGAGTIDFCAMHGTLPSEEDQRTVWTAGDYIDQQLLSILTENYPEARLNLEAVREYKEKWGYVGDIRGAIQVTVPVEGVMTDIDITDELKRACESILAPIVETTIDLIARFDSDYQERLRKNLILAGGGSQIRNISQELEKALGEYGEFTVRSVDDPLFAGAQGALELAKDMPQEYWEEM